MEFASDVTEIVPTTIPRLELTVESALTPRGMIVRLIGGCSNSDADAEKLRAELLSVNTDSYNVLVVDLSGLTSINSAVLGALLLCRKLMISRNGILRLAGAKPEAIKLIERCRVTGMFKCFADVEAALNAAV